ncbi:hypothetical protein Taro_027855 [Colocasia esculenta]|uniref:Secreted protein n=1 Tax=Colocasia esculenta TaxID=4460 RepID=A0A843VGW1_COLES|nr:hypothetical protein [Colocasia esculenta]
MLIMIPSPCGMFVLCFWVVSERTAPEPPSAEDATAIEVAMMLRPAWPPRHHRDALGRRDKSSPFPLLSVRVAPVLVS